MIQRPSDGYIIIGGARTQPKSIKALVGNTDDTQTVPEMSKYLGQVVRSHFEEFGQPGSGGTQALGSTPLKSASSAFICAEGCVRQWTGVMGYTHSGLPYVGEIPSKHGQFISAGQCVTLFF